MPGGVVSAPSPGPSAGLPGFYGKVPSKGDFVSRRLSRPFIEAWDGWLQPAISCSREQLGEAWTDTYLTSPLWRFCLPAGACGDDAVVGVLMPSVDRVGRYFPLTIAAALPEPRALTMLPPALDEWLGWAENAALSCLEDGFDLDRFDAELTRTPATCNPVPAAPAPTMISPSALVAPIDGSDPAPAFPLLIGDLLERLLGRYSLWWTTGSDRIAPTLVASAGMPRIGGFAAFLDGQWAQWGWTMEGGPDAGGAMVLTKENTA